MSGDTLTWFWGVVGLIVAFGLAFVGGKAWSAKQKQKIDRGSTGYQAGGDINVRQHSDDGPDRQP